MFNIVFLLAAAAICVNAEVGLVCTDHAQCGAGECCQILSEFMVMSRRAGPGTCQMYSLEGEPCGLYDKMNGYCSCTPGTSCVAREVPIPPTPAVQKRRPAPPHPGYMYNVTCVRDAN
ncbi:uncharacterized protein LOC131940978 [Physella acuta]|uniref:uncharacterized protein LOC131940978 n=1 Tax=Physella acuta TaxID=109671 RepID=UPI0027DE7C6F|nr:uncharacterized protein LOC131940978 [Physella acuta]